MWVLRRFKSDAAGRAVTRKERIGDIPEAAGGLPFKAPSPITTTYLRVLPPNMSESPDLSCTRCFAACAHTCCTPRYPASQQDRVKRDSRQNTQGKHEQKNQVRQAIKARNGGESQVPGIFWPFFVVPCAEPKSVMNKPAVSSSIHLSCVRACAVSVLYKPSQTHSCQHLKPGSTNTSRERAHTHTDACCREPDGCSMIQSAVSSRPIEIFVNAGAKAGRDRTRGQDTRIETQGRNVTINGYRLTNL
jgi:hypothetical protein